MLSWITWYTSTRALPRPEGQFTGQELEQDDAEGVDVGVGS